MKPTETDTTTYLACLRDTWGEDSYIDLIWLLRERQQTQDNLERLRKNTEHLRQIAA